MIRIANNGKESLLVPAAGRYGSFMLRPGIATIHDEHWTALQALVRKMPDAYSMAVHSGALCEVPDAPPPRAEKADLFAPALDAPDETHVTLDIPEADLPPKDADALRPKKTAKKKTRKAAKK